MTNQSAQPITEKNLAEKLAGIYGDINDYDWATVARTAAEVLGVDLAPEPEPLPTEPGSVIIATEVRGVKGKWRMFCDPNGDWFSEEEIANREYHDPGHVTAWTEARVVPVTAAPVALAEDQVGEEWTKQSALPVEWSVLGSRLQERITAIVNTFLAQHAAPAEGQPIANAAKPIDPKDVRVDDRVWMESKNGDEATFTVTAVGVYALCSRSNAYDFSNIRSVRLLHREEV